MVIFLMRYGYFKSVLFSITLHFKMNEGELREPKNNEWFSIKPFISFAGRGSVERDKYATKPFW